jgi:hypothetical protein
MRNGPSRHSVWVDVFGVVLLGALVLGGAAYLLFQAKHIPRTLAVETMQEAERRTASQRRRAQQTPRSQPRTYGRTVRPSPPSEPLLGSRSGALSSPSTVPFSKSWREGATPRLNGTAGGPGTAAQEPSFGATSGANGAAAMRTSPSIAARGGGTSGGTDYNSGWQAEARRLAGRARTLSGALRQLDRSEETSGESPSQRSASARTAATGGQPTSSDRDVPNPPDPVPIDDHLHWLVVAGLLWGAWRIGRGT